MNKPQYMKYLASRQWALLKREVRKRSEGRCERCHIGRYEATHHLTYERIGHERLDDLLAVCTGCHDYLSGNTDFDRRRGLEVIYMLSSDLPGAMEIDGHGSMVTAFFSGMKGTQFDGLEITISVHSNKPGIYMTKREIRHE